MAQAFKSQTVSFDFVNDAAPDVTFPKRFGNIDQGASESALWEFGDAIASLTTGNAVKKINGIVTTEFTR